jgi:hypothetical protein
VDQTAYEEAMDGLEELKRETGFDLRDDVLAALGDSWTVYYEGHLGMTGLTAVAQVRDRERLAAVQEKFIAMISGEASPPSADKTPEQIEADEEAMAFEQDGFFGREREPRVEKFQFAGQQVCVYDSGQMFFFFSPSWCLTEEELVVALFPQNIKAYLSRDTQFKSLATEPRVAKMFSPGQGPIALSYYDTREVFDMVYSSLLFYIQLGKYAMSEAGIDLKMSILPSPQSIRKHLLPGTMQIRRTEAGIEMTSRQSLPGGNLVMTLPLGAGLATWTWVEPEPPRIGPDLPDVEPLEDLAEPEAIELEAPQR